MENLSLTTNTTSNAPQVSNQSVSINVDQAIEEWKAYQKVTELILDETDYVLIKGKNYKKKSAWRKYAKAFNISDEIVKEDIVKTEKGSVKEATFVVRCTLPNGRYAEGWGNCSRQEGTKAHPNHDIPSTAHTRAKNRAIADLIGAGEVTAEEIQAEIREAARSNAEQKFNERKSAKVQKPKPQPKKTDDLEFIDVKVEVVKDPQPEDLPEPQVNTLDNAEEIAASIISELPEKSLVAAYKELARLNQLDVLSDKECESVKKEIDKVLK